MDALLTAVNWENLAANLCYAILAFSYIVTNICWLRSLAILALGLEGVYFYVGSTPPLWVGIAWALVFVAINAVQLALMARARLGVSLGDHERTLHQGLFEGMTYVAFHRLLKSGEWRRCDGGRELTVEGQPVSELYVVAEGMAKVEVNGDIVALVQPGSFVGEMSFLTGAPACATVTTVGPCRIFSISKTRLSKLLAVDEELRTAIHRTMGRDLVYKLKCTLQQTEAEQTETAQNEAA
jgi:CRP-like cAMP-binding protein